MDTARLDAMEFEEPRPGCHRARLSDELGTAAVAINYYRIEPRAGLPGGLHAHMDQEELFVVLSGEATFETMHGPMTVEAGEIVRFAPGEYQSGHNEADRELVLLAFGAPKASHDVRIPVVCPACHEADLQLATRGSSVRFVCPACTWEGQPDDCPQCGGDELQLTRHKNDGTIVVCGGCGAAFDRPPVRSDNA